MDNIVFYSIIAYFVICFIGGCHTYRLCVKNSIKRFGEMPDISECLLYAYVLVLMSPLSFPVIAAITLLNLGINKNKG